MANPRRVKTTESKTMGIPEQIVRDAMAAPELKGRVFLCSTRREPLVCDGKVVGFVTPHETPSGWRHGPIYVDPEYRECTSRPAGAYTGQSILRYAEDGAPPTLLRDESDRSGQSYILFRCVRGNWVLVGSLCRGR